MSNTIIKDITVTGPRSQFLYGNNPSHVKYLQMIGELITLLGELPYKIRKLYNGMATGLDMMMALAVINYNARHDDDIELICCIPGINQTKYYSPEEKMVYGYILNKVPSEQVLQLSQEECTGKVLKQRNKDMIDPSDELLSFWDNERYKSGTYSAIRYAQKTQKPVFNVHPLNMEDRGYMKPTLKRR